MIHMYHVKTLMLRIILVLLNSHQNTRHWRTWSSRSQSWSRQAGLKSCNRRSYSPSAPALLHFHCGSSQPLEFAIPPQLRPSVIINLNMGECRYANAPECQRHEGQSQSGPRGPLGRMYWMNFGYTLTLCQRMDKPNYWFR